MNLHTREEWLIRATELLSPFFSEAGYTLSDKIRLSVGFPSKSALSRKSKRIGECWYPSMASDGYHHVFISPLLGDAVDVLATLVHELLHVALPPAAGHKAPFKAGMKALGLEGKATATEAGEALKGRLNTMLDVLGPYPHGALHAKDLESKKQSTRLLKAQCPSGDNSEGKVYTVRITRVHLDKFGAPICPACLKRMVNENGEAFETDDEEDNNDE